MESLLANSDFLKTLFNAVPALLFIVDDDVKILSLNAAAEAFAARPFDDIYLKKGGEILDCVHATEVPEGCGKAPACKDCVIRNSVYEAFSGRTVSRRKTTVRHRNNGSEKEIHLLVTASPFEHAGKKYCLLIMEDVNELEKLRSIIPICAWCKKIRNDDNYWASVEEYFSTNMDLSFSHGMCGECFSKYRSENLRR